MNGKLFFLPRLLLLAQAVCHVGRCHHMIGKLFFLPRLLLLVVAVCQVGRCHHKTGSFFLLPRLPLSCGDSDLTPGAVPASSNLVD